MFRGHGGLTDRSRFGLLALKISLDWIGLVSRDVGRSGGRAEWRNKRLDVVVRVIDNGFLAYS